MKCVIEPGDTLLIPANWRHHVRGLEKSITVGHNFFNDSNFTQHMVDILRELPALAKGIDRSPSWREELRINGTCRILQPQMRDDEIASPARSPYRPAGTYPLAVYEV